MTGSVAAGPRGGCGAIEVPWPRPGCSGTRGCCWRSRWPGRSILLLGGRRTNSVGPPGRRRHAARRLRLRRDRVRRDARLPGRRSAAGSCTCSPGSTSARSDVDIGLQLDQLSICFVLLITGVGSLIHIFAVGYMAHDPERRRFFGYMNLFVAAMLLLVLADNYLVPVRRVGGRRPGLLPADRLLAVQARRRDRGQEGVHREPGRRRRAVDRDHADVRDFGTVTFAGVFSRRRPAPASACHRDRAAAAARRLRQVRPSCRCSPGCWTRWRAPPRSRR